MRTEIRINAGGQHSGALKLTNQTDKRARISTETLDFYIDSTATPQFGRSFEKEADYSCREWLTVNPMQFEVAPGADATIRYTIAAPQAAAERSYQCAVGFTAAPPVEKAPVSSLRTAVRIVAAFYVVIGKPSVDGAVKEIRLEPVADPNGPPAWRAVAVIENRGAYYFRPSGSLDVLDNQGKVVESVDLNPVVALPKREQNYFFPLTKVRAEGRYTLRLKVDLGGNEIQEATANVVAQPPSH
ncbi:MAG TPA: hypothetical protein VMU19_14950 [Bryobacteraceae bacterium]|nr:hypothetical protein [Bryobacteraceae bacterium]